jgi:hypothetical protein
MTLICLERLDAQGNCRSAKPLWLAWVGESSFRLEIVSLAYLRRFIIEHWYRASFRNLTLDITTPEYIRTM